MAGVLASVGLAALLLAGLLLPPGYALARALRVDAGGLPGLAIALGLGYSTLLPLLLVSGSTVGPWLLLAVAGLCLAWLRPGLAALRALRGLAPSLLVPALLAAVAVVVNANDAVATPEGLSLRLGFDVADRAYYAAVAQELLRAPLGSIENPVFAGLPLQYAYFPSLTGALIQQFTSLPMLTIFLGVMPPLALFFVGLAAQAVLEDWGVASRAARGLVAALLVFGGDLSFLVTQPPSLSPERFQYFFVFYSFSGECLFYNPWMLGLPLVLVSLMLARRYLAEARGGDLAATSLLVGMLWQTKSFGCMALIAGAALHGLLSRSRRPLLLAGGAALVACPWLLWSLTTATSRDGAPLAPAFLYLLRASFEDNPTLRALALALGVEVEAFPHRALGILGFATVFLAGGLGVRLLGLPRLAAEVRRDRHGIAGLVLSTLVVLVVAGFFLEGNPTRIEGVQFLLLAQSLLWLYAGPVLWEGIYQASLGQRLLALTLTVIAVVTPTQYLARKAWPERYTRAGSTDRLRYVFPATTREASQWLADQGSSGDRVLLPVSAAPEDRFGDRPLYFSVLSGRRVLAHSTTFHVGPRIARERLQAVQRFYATHAATEAEAILDGLRADWVLEDETRPLGFQSRRLGLSHVSGPVRLYRVLAP